MSNYKYLGEISKKRKKLWWIGVGILAAVALFMWTLLAVDHFKNTKNSQALSTETLTKFSTENATEATTDSSMNTCSLTYSQTWHIFVVQLLGCLEI